MHDVAFLRERIESYADYTNAESARLTDEQIRAFVGEALSRLQERLQPADTTADALGRALLRCQFADQNVIRALDKGAMTHAELDAIHAADGELVALAESADRMTAGEIADFIGRVAAALDERARIAIATGASNRRYQPL